MPYLLAEFEVALVVRGDGHDGAGAVAHQDEVADPDGDLLAAVRIDGVVAGEEAFLFDVAGTVLRRAHPSCAWLAAFASPASNSETSGCSGARITQVAP